MKSKAISKRKSKEERFKEKYEELLKSDKAGELRDPKFLTYSHEK